MNYNKKFQKLLCTISVLSVTFGYSKAYSNSDTCLSITCPTNMVVYACAGDAVTYSPPKGNDVCALNQVFNPTGSLQTWVVPTGVETIKIEASGAEGGSGFTGTEYFTGGKGAVIEGEFSVTPGETLNIVVGEKGEDGGTKPPPNNTVAGGGGGGSFVYRGAIGGSGLMIAAGGGGGGGEEGSTTGCDARSDIYSSSLPPSCSQNLNDGQGGSGGGFNGGGGGTGWLSDGQDYSNLPGSGGDRFAGGIGHQKAGGYGGGGGTWDGGAGGGGYTGGPGGDNNEPPGEGEGGGGGGSYNSGTNQSNSIGRNGDGVVKISDTSVVTTTQIGGIGSGGNFPLGTTTETYEVNNSFSGESATCSFDITVIKRTPTIYPITSKDGKTSFFVADRCE